MERSWHICRWQMKSVLQLFPHIITCGSLGWKAPTPPAQLPPKERLHACPKSSCPPARPDAGAHPPAAFGALQPRLDHCCVVLLLAQVARQPIHGGLRGAKVGWGVYMRVGVEGRWECETWWGCDGWSLTDGAGWWVVQEVGWGGVPSHASCGRGLLHSSMRSRKTCQEPPLARSVPSLKIPALPPCSAPNPSPAAQCPPAAC